MVPTLVSADEDPANPVQDVTILTASINGVTAPVKGETPVAKLDDTTEYTATIEWSPSDATFKADTEYKATITIIPQSGYTLTGVPKDFFKVEGAEATNDADSGVITVVFPKTAADEQIPLQEEKPSGGQDQSKASSLPDKSAALAVYTSPAIQTPNPLTITTQAINGVTAPVSGVAPVSTLIGTSEYSVTIAWNPADSLFVANTTYSAIITITPNPGYTLTGVPENFFTVAGATATNASSSGVVTAVFPRTESQPISIASITGVSAPTTGITPTTKIPDTAEYTASIEWSPAIGTIFEANTEYTAIITITPNSGYTLTGVPQNFFTVPGATSTNTTDSGIVTAVFPKTGPSATTNEAGDTVTLTFDKVMADPSADAGSFQVVTVGFSFGEPVEFYSMGVASAALDADPTKIDLTLTEPIKRGDIVLVDYTPGTVASADTTPLAAFYEPVWNIVPDNIETDLEGSWDIYDHVGWWGELYSDDLAFPTGDDPRGKEFNRHIVTSGSSVIFYGNGVQPYKDFLFLPSNQNAAKSFTFDLDLSGVKAHSMEGGGFLFNTEINENLMNGYCALFEIHDEDNDNQNITFTVELYQMDDVPVDQFHDGIYSNETSYENLRSLGTGISLLGSYPLPTDTKYTICLEASSSTVDIWNGNTKLISNLSLPKAYGNGVGVIGSYNSHYCDELSYFEFSNLNIQGVADLSAVLAGDQANLTFTQPVGATAVKAEQSTDGGATWTPAALANPIDASSTTATVMDLTPNQTYYFRLDITGGIYDGYSRVATAEYFVGPIDDLAAKAGNGTANLTWTPPEGAISQSVMQSTDGGKIWTPSAIDGPIDGTSTAATVTGLTNGQLYSFKIVVEGEGISGDSNIANARPTAPSESNESSSPNHHHQSSSTVTILDAKIPAGFIPDHIAYIQGYPDNTIRPEGNVTREEVAAALFRLLDPTYRDTIQTTSSTFSDIERTRWSVEHIGTLSTGKIIEGYPDGTFKPSNYITRAELAAMASRFDKLSSSDTNKFSDIDGNWAAEYINSAAQKGWITGYSDGTFKPDQYVSRAEFVTFVNNALNRKVNAENILSDAKQFSDLKKGTWYYEAIQEAANSHLYETSTDKIEKWTKIYTSTDEMK